MRLSVRPGRHRLATWNHVILTGVLLLALSFLQGCATELTTNARIAKQQGADFTADELTRSTLEQDRILVQLQLRAGLGRPAATAGDWDNIIAAGLEYADARCENYMGALVRLNRDKKTTASEIGLVGTATAGVMAAARSAAREIAIAAIAFGLASSTVDNLGGNVLYEIEPSSVRALVKALQVKYKAALPKGYVSRPAAMQVIRGYAALCTPANIEAELNHAVKNAQPLAAEGDGASGRAPEVSNAETSLTDRYGPDATSALLDDFIRVDGRIADAPRRKLEAAMTQIGVTGISVLKFINGAEYAGKRLDALKILLANR
jgi:hypothetical protein